MLPLGMISQECDFLFMPPQSENVYKLRKNYQNEKALGPMSSWGKTEQWQGRSQARPSCCSPLRAPLLKFSGTILRRLFLINGRKSINPTILFIQIRNKLQMWPTKEIK